MRHAAREEAAAKPRVHEEHLLPRDPERGGEQRVARDGQQQQPHQQVADLRVRAVGATVSCDASEGVFARNPCRVSELRSEQSSWR